MVEVDIAVGVRSIKALIKEAPRGWSPNPPYLLAGNLFLLICSSIGERAFRGGARKLERHGQTLAPGRGC